MNEEFKNYIPPSWDTLFMRSVYEIAAKSKDDRSKIGSVLVKDRRIIVSGYNGIIEGVEDDINKVPERYERPEKYFWQEHSERNILYFAAREGIATKGSILYTNGIPCSDCMRGVLQAGIIEIIVHKQWMDHEISFNRDKWNNQAVRSIIMMDEKHIPYREFDEVLNMDGYMDGKIIKI